MSGPTPWTADRNPFIKGAYTIRDAADKCLVSARRPLNAETAALIVKAVNAHDVLMTALADILDPNCIRTSEGFRQIARAALAKLTS